MDEQNIQKKLVDLMSEITTLPRSERDKLAEVAERSEQRREKLRDTVGSLQESLTHLRLSVKYLVFDLEATRRENAYLRRIIERQNQELEGDPREDDTPPDAA